MCIFLLIFIKWRKNSLWAFDYILDNSKVLKRGGNSIQINLNENHKQDNKMQSIILSGRREQHAKECALQKNNSTTYQESGEKKKGIKKGTE